MRFKSNAIISNTEMIKSYKDCRLKANSYGKVFILKNNMPDAVLYSIEEYEKISMFIEYLDKMEEKDIIQLLKTLNPTI